MDLRPEDGKPAKQGQVGQKATQHRGAQIVSPRLQVHARRDTMLETARALA